MAKKMYIVIGPNGACNKNHLDAFLKARDEIFTDGTRNFGAGDEKYVECAACGRELPTIVCQLDHILPQAVHAATNLGAITNEKFRVFDMTGKLLNVPPDQTAVVEAQGGLVKVIIGRGYNPKYTLNSALAVWECDFGNLQWLCSHCNGSKSKKEWNVWAAEGHSTRPLSERWKQAMSIVAMDVS
jgi:hypothetical protein